MSVNAKYLSALKSIGPQLFIFSLAVAGMGVASGIYETSFNNYLNDIFSIGASARGFLEFPRELPGLLVILSAGALIQLGQVRVVTIAMSLLALGFFGLAFLSPDYSVMIIWLVIWSTGNHLFMPLEGSIAVNLAEKRSVGQVLGMLGSIRLATTVLGASIILFGMGSFLSENLTYQHTFSIAALFALFSVVVLLKLKPLKVEGEQTRLVWKKQYRIFYWLSLLWGFRKQMFITFAPWLLVQTFDQPASIIAQLWIITSILGIFFRPLLGRISDKFGERAILLGELPIITLVFLGYAFSPYLNSGVYLVYVCYVINSLLNAMTMIRTSYVSKILTNKNDLTPTLAMGVTLDHASAMTMPVVGGLLWSLLGSQYLFLFAILFIIIYGYFANQISVIPKNYTDAVTLS